MAYELLWRKRLGARRIIISSGSIVRRHALIIAPLGVLKLTHDTVPCKILYVPKCEMPCDSDAKSEAVSPDFRSEQGWLTGICCPSKPRLALPCPEALLARRSHLLSIYEWSRYATFDLCNRSTEVFVRERHSIASVLQRRVSMTS